MIYQIQKGCKYFGSSNLFENMDWGINDQKKIAIVGRNGCGKTTLLKIIAGSESLSSGKIIKAKNIRIGYLAQAVFDDEQITVRDELARAFSYVKQLEEELKELEDKLKHTSNETILARFATVQSLYEENGGYQQEADMLTVFTKFSFLPEQLDKKIEDFSGGEKTRIAFCRLLLEQPDILLLDEPTNHLDIDTIEWLQGYLKRYNKSIILVSHDRMFLDQIVQEVYEIECSKMYRYVGNYSQYREAKKVDIERNAQAYNAQQKELQRLDLLIEKFRYKKNKAAFAQSKIKYRDRIEHIEKRASDNKAFNAHFNPRVKGGKQVCLVDELQIGYDKVLATITMSILQGQRIAILGPNGHGKSTFVKTIMNIVPKLGGSFLLGHQIEIGYFDQQIAQMNGTQTVLEDVWNEYPQLKQVEVRNVLGSFLFSADDVFKQIDMLSGGEKVRLALVKLLLQQPNFLVLDEPTNHLDIVGKEALEDSLKAYKGTILFVSHDRYFVKQVATHILEIKDGSAIFYPCDYNAFLDKQIEDDKQSELKEVVSLKSKHNNHDEKKLKKLEEKISEQEDKLESLRDLRYEPEYYHDFNKMQELDQRIDDLVNSIHTDIDVWEDMQGEE